MELLDDNRIFALDIGTRSVIGVVVEKTENTYNLIAEDMEEHNTRAMMDGQIHNINKVAEVVAKVRHRLEQKTKMTLQKAAVAAAGRALITKKAEASKLVNRFVEVMPEEVKALEWEACRKALAMLDETGNNTNGDYYCVGYSVVCYKLDDDIIGDLVGQKGSKISVQVIATFLPRVVVESLMTVLKKCNLELYSMTLEPIAACHVVIPENMRQLNVALVDIGAGTSDIAITRNGSIYSYGMVPMAGDEISEKLCEILLLDFNTAETVKRRIMLDETLTYEDILGFEHKTRREEICRELLSTVGNLAGKIAECIIEINGKTPHAVICVGGGSLTPMLPAKLAEALGLPASRVGVRGTEVLKNIKGISEELKSPVFVTPLGIAINALENRGVRLINVSVNGRLLQLFEFDNPTVAGALLRAGQPPGNVFGKPGMARTFELNGKIQVVKGGAGSPAQVKVNGRIVGLNHPLRNGDEVQFVPGRAGEDARVKVEDVIPVNYYRTITVNGKEIKSLPEVHINGIKVKDFQTEIPDGAKVTVSGKDMILSDVFNYVDITPSAPSGRLVIRLNGQDADFVSKVEDGDTIEIYWDGPVN